MHPNSDLQHDRGVRGSSVSSLGDHGLLCSLRIHLLKFLLFFRLLLAWDREVKGLAHKCSLGGSGFRDGTHCTHTRVVRRGARFWCTYGYFDGGRGKGWANVSVFTIPVWWFWYKMEPTKEKVGRESWLLIGGDWNKTDRLFGTTWEANDRRIDTWMTSGTHSRNILHNSERTVVDVKTKSGTKDLDGRLDVFHDSTTQWICSYCHRSACSTASPSARVCDMAGRKDVNITARWQKLYGHGKNSVKYEMNESPHATRVGHQEDKDVSSSHAPPPYTRVVDFSVAADEKDGPTDGDTGSRESGHGPGSGLRPTLDGLHEPDGDPFVAGDHVDPMHAIGSNPEPGVDANYDPMQQGYMSEPIPLNVMNSASSSKPDGDHSSSRQYLFVGNEAVDPVCVDPQIARTKGKGITADGFIKVTKKKKKNNGPKPRVQIPGLHVSKPGPKYYYSLIKDDGEEVESETDGTSKMMSTGVS
ncbi:hypothetical protein L1987_64530 [Smallanthus sonchifolius]|uniref:Uncharacterized protein n=1 Tax=Smallanthus sonchifolius TaxID=185202 RepID=A0ACB9BS13_9ASTR|nr:hypothetical protein L1987_64530 [Smallanthus sonchifolius]